MTDPNATTDKLPTPAPLPPSSSSSTLTNTTPIEGQLLETGVTAVKPGHKTSEAALTLLSILVGATLASGMLVNNTIIQLFGIAQMTLSSLGYTWSRTAVKNAAMLLIFVGFVHTQTACSSAQRAELASDAVDCLKAEQAKAITAFGPAFDQLLVLATGGDGKVDVGQLKAGAKGLGIDVGGCVLADAVARAMAPKPADPNAPKASPLVADPASLHAAFEEVRSTQLGGKTFHTAHGDV